MSGIQHDDGALVAISEVKHAHVDEKRDVESRSTSDSEPELDGIHDGLEFPTEEEKLTLRRVADTIPWNAYREWRARFLFNTSK